MMNRTRQIIAVTLVATALCADRALAAAPVVNQRVASVASQVAERFVKQFRRTVPSFRRIEQRRPGGIAQDPAKAAPVADPVVAPFAFTPFQFRLPPPVA